MERTRRQVERHWGGAVALLVLSTIGYVGARAFADFRASREVNILVTGVSWSPANPGCVSLQTDKGTFFARQEAMMSLAEANPWFWFRVGESYRVHVRGTLPRVVGGSGRRQIVEAHPIVHAANIAASDQ